MDLTFEAAEIGLDGQILDDFILAAWSKIQGPIFQVEAQITSGNRCSRSPGGSGLRW